MGTRTYTHIFYSLLHIRSLSRLSTCLWHVFITAIFPYVGVVFRMDIICMLCHFQDFRSRAHRLARRLSLNNNLQCQILKNVYCAKSNRLRKVLVKRRHQFLQYIYKGR